MDVKWIEFFTELGVTTAGQILVFIAIGFFGKKLFEFFFNASIEIKKAELNTELENFKQNLSSEAQNHKLELDKNLESHKSLLSQASQENQIRFSKLHSDRAEIVKNLYSKLVTMEKSMNSFMAPFQAAGDIPLEEKRRIAANDGNDFSDYFDSNEIFFNENTCSIINSINENFEKAFNEFTAISPGQPNAQNEILRMHKSMNAYYDILNKKVVELKSKLKADFRDTLGVK
ncbi:hypothetical protein C8C83_5429 [Flavobacterium sp. 90]|uniref:hypothetical protein n=1 Tax=unclassified Flavobacterium TaxID=196869 RepID=UPI000EB55450|nr:MULTISPECIES: hypothetical protein [unclassified Flavobacterium]RKR08194.1 hypothetical protein C8C82_0056 [Flavobacterium sp. 81]TCK57385.1 hypothetical protein C8C83_5429 [Flavobacterium sp. 90]